MFCPKTQLKYEYRPQWQTLAWPSAHASSVPAWHTGAPCNPRGAPPEEETSLGHAAGCARARPGPAPGACRRRAALAGAGRHKGRAAGEAGPPHPHGHTGQTGTKGPPRRVTRSGRAGPAVSTAVPAAPTGRLRCAPVTHAVGESLRHPPKPRPTVCQRHFDEDFCNVFKTTEKIEKSMNE